MRCNRTEVEYGNIIAELLLFLSHSFIQSMDVALRNNWPIRLVTMIFVAVKWEDSICRRILFVIVMECVDLPQTMSDSTVSNRCCQLMPAEQFRSAFPDHSDSQNASCPDGRRHLWRIEKWFHFLFVFNTRLWEAAALTFVPMNLRVHFCSPNHLNCYLVAATARNPMANACGRCCSVKSTDLDQNRIRMSNCPNAIHQSAETIELGPIRRCMMHIVMLKNFKFMHSS